MYLPYIFLLLGENYCPLVINITVNNDLDPENVSSLNHLRAVPPIVTVHMFWTSQVWSEIFGFLGFE